VGQKEVDLRNRLGLVESQNKLYLLEIDVIKKRIEELEARLARSGHPPAYLDQSAAMNDQLRQLDEQLASAGQLIQQLRL
jgi:hypothetical protein